MDHVTESVQMQIETQRMQKRMVEGQRAKQTVEKENEQLQAKIKVLEKETRKPKVGLALSKDAETKKDPADQTLMVMLELALLAGIDLQSRNLTAYASKVCPALSIRMTKT